MGSKEDTSQQKHGIEIFFNNDDLNNNNISVVLEKARQISLLSITSYSTTLSEEAEEVNNDGCSTHYFSLESNNSDIPSFPSFASSSSSVDDDDTSSLVSDITEDSTFDFDDKMMILLYD